MQILKTNTNVFVLLLIIGVAVYGNVITGKFLFDDNLFIENNKQVHSLSNSFELYFSSVTGGSNVAADNFYRPNQQLVNALIYSVFGLDPIPYHLTSILLHGLNACLIFLIFIRLGVQRTPSFFGSLVFLIHPIQTQAVSYISGMADPLGMAFTLFAIYLFIKSLYANNKNQFFGYTLGVVGFYVLGLLTKENTVILPALIVITFTFLFERVRSNSNYRLIYVAIGAYFIITIAYLVLKFTVLNFAGTIGLSPEKNIYTESLYIRIVTFITILPEYVKMILFPLHLNYEKPFTAYTDFSRSESIFGLLLIISGTGVSVYSFIKKNKAFFFSFLWFFICLAPVSGIIPVNAMYLEHWLYYPIIGVIFYAAISYEKIKGFGKQIVTVFIIILLMAYTVKTVSRNFQWADPIKFYKNELKYSKSSARINNNLAMVYAEDNKCPLAIQHYKKAVSLYDVYPQTHHNMARCFQVIGNLDEALNEYFRALLMYPNFIYSLNDLYQIYIQTGDQFRADRVGELITRIDRGETISKDEIITLINTYRK